jgi:hypothetical protein
MSRDTHPGSKFDDLLLAAVDRALAESLGESVSGAIKACIPVSTISTDPKGFAMKLERMTGGTKLVEKKIMRNLEILISQRGVKQVELPEVEHQDFSAFIQSTRKQFG